MDWILDNLQIVVIGVFVLGSLLKSVFSKALGRPQEKEDYEEETYDEQQRYPMPQPSVPPPLPQASVPPPLERHRQAEVSTKARRESAREEAALKHQQDLAERLRKIRETKAASTGGAASTKARAGKKKPVQATALVSPTLRARLGNAAEVRRAFVLREILGPPAGLR